MIERFCIVIDELGFKIDCSPMISDTELLGYELKEGEKIIEKDWDIAHGMHKPQWDFDNNVWVDTDPLPPVEPIPEKDKTRIWQDQVEEAIGLLATQVAQNTLLQNGGK